MIIKLTDSDFDNISDIISDATIAYKNILPSNCWKKLYAAPEDFKTAIQFYGLKEDNTLHAVIGIQYINGIVLIRHLYVLTDQQRKGYGKKLLKHVMTLTETSTFLVCLWKTAFWAVNFFTKYGFKETAIEEKNSLLLTHYPLLKHQENFIILKIKKQTPKTLILPVNPKKPDPQKIQTAATIIQTGGLVAFPTETVYGLGADALNINALSRLFKAKNRPPDNPPILHIADINQVYPLVKEMPNNAEIIMKHFWPGPLTLIFKRSETIPQEATAGLDTIAIRMPNHSIAIALIKQSGTAIAAPSANLSGKPSPTTAQHVYDDLNGKIDAILDGGPTSIGVESTVLDLSVNPPMLLRPGGTPFEAIQQVLSNVVLHPSAISEQEITVKYARSPGMNYKHYAPNAEVLLVEGTIQAMVTKIVNLSEQYNREGKKVGILATDETQKKYSANVVKSMGSRSNLDTIANRLFKTLREFNENDVDVILSESVPLDGMGLAVMNRLRKASGYHIIKV